MISRYALFVLLVFFGESCQAISRNERPQDFIGYQVRNGLLTEVYEAEGDQVTFGGPEILGAGRFQSEFGGTIQSCTSSQFYCFSSVLRIAIPRSGTQSVW